jgi:hypothetical protein
MVCILCFEPISDKNELKHLLSEVKPPDSRAQTNKVVFFATPASTAIMEE